MTLTKINSIDEYISQQAQETQERLQQIRATIKTAAPSAIEKISYGMPTFYLNGNLVHFAAHTNHIGFYPMPNAIITFQKQLSPYKCSKGAIQFPYINPLPDELISEIVKYRVTENLNKNSPITNFPLQ